MVAVAVTVVIVAMTVACGDLFCPYNCGRGDFWNSCCTTGRRNATFVNDFCILHSINFHTDLHIFLLYLRKS